MLRCWIIFLCLFTFTFWYGKYLLNMKFIYGTPVFVIPIHLIAGIPGKRYSSSFSPYWKMGWEYGSWLLGSFPLGAYNKGIDRAFYLLKCLGGILHLKPTAGCQISTLIFGYGGGGAINIPWKIAEGRPSSFPLEV